MALRVIYILLLISFCYTVKSFYTMSVQLLVRGKKSSTNQQVDETQEPCTRELSEFVSSNSFFLLPKKEKVPLSYS